MAEAKVFPMNTFVACLRGGEGADQSLTDLLAFVTQSEVDSEFAPFAAALSKAWIYEQNPELTKYKAADLSKLGQKAQLAPLPEEDLAVAQGILAKMAALKAANESLTAKVAGLEAEKKQLADDLAAAKGSLKKYEQQAAAGDPKLEVSSKKLDDYIKKLEDLLAQIDKVKKEGVVVAGPAGAGGAPAAAAEGGSASGPEVGGEPEGSFGFGSDAFNSDSW